MARLPKDMGYAVQNVGRMRRLVISNAMDDTDEDELSAGDSRVTALFRHRLKSVAQVSKYWPLSKLATLSDEEILEPTADKPLNPPPIHTLSPTPKLGRIVLLGSEHGLPTLPNLLTDQILTIHVDRVLADKLVLHGVLDLIPSKTELIIAKKFPGMHENQEETMHLTVEGARKGLHIVPVCSPLSTCLVTNLLPL